MAVKDQVVVRPADVQFRMAEFLKQLDNQSTNANFYLEYFSAASIGNMLNDVTQFDWASFLKLKMTNVWIGNGKTRGKLHFDPFENLLCQIQGTKVVHLFNPLDNRNLYEGHIREAQFSYDLKSANFKRDHLLDSTSMVMSPVDIENPNLERFPLFSNAMKNRMECTIESGDVLYLPSFYWHEVQSKPNQFGRNIAVNYWFEPFITKEFPCEDCPMSVNNHYNWLFEEFQTLADGNKNSFY